MSRAYQLDVRLPEGVTFTLPLAGPVSRFLAWLIDLLLCLALIMTLNRFLMPLAIIAPDAALALSVLFVFAVPVVYGIAFEALWRGQTPGKRALRLRVLDEGGLRLDTRQVVVRNVLRMVDMLPQFYLVGGVACLCSARAQRLGDLAAGTVVIRTKAVPPPDLTQLAAGKHNSLRDDALLGARLRQRISPAEAAIALQALVRRETIEPAARALLFKSLAERFNEAAPLAESLTEHLTDEQIVRDTVDVLYRREAP